MDASLDLQGLHAAHLGIERERFERALEASGYSGALIYSGSLTPIFADDQSYPFKAHAWFKAWVPVGDLPESFVYFAPGAQRPLVLFSQPAGYWHKAAERPRDYWTAHVDLEPVVDLAAARAALPRDLGSIAYVGERFPELAQWGVAAENPPRLMSRLDFDRAFKTPFELACLRAANRLAALGHRAAARAFEEGRSALEIELEFLRACGAREQELPYSPIVALNENGAVLHYQRLERTPPAASRSLLIDAGVESAGYASDVTRTYSRNAEFAALIERFEELQQTLCASVHSGVDWRDVHLTAHHLVADLLRDADITRCEATEAVETGVSSVFLPHGVGHLLGLQVHDAGGLLRSPDGEEVPRPEGHPHLRLTRVLAEGFVVTMEPGIYFIEQLLAQARADTRARHINWSRVESLKPFGGIRIEDDLAVETTGAENLTRDAFAAVERGPTAPRSDAASTRDA